MTTWILFDFSTSCLKDMLCLNITHSFTSRTLLLTVYYGLQKISVGFPWDAAAHKFIPTTTIYTATFGI